MSSLPDTEITMKFTRKAKTRQPSKGAKDEAKKNRGGWVYEIRGDYQPADDVPPQAIIGAWKVDDNGVIVGDFMPNPNFEERG